MEKIIQRIKNILLSPKTEWTVIEGENAPHAKVTMGYLLVLALIPAVAALIGWGFVVRYSSFGFGIMHALTQFITMIGGAYLTAFVIDMLAPNFGSQKNFNKAFELVAYAYTPALVGGIFYIVPALSFLASLASIYSLVLLYMGLAPMMKTPDDKKTSYFIVSLLVMVAAFILLGIVLGAILGAIFVGAAYRF
ncbi:MAG: YIP1 family protein [Paludibacter sp.]|jgi:hypothetical protein|nr:YIP1 family protein [Paludibacter sp.]